MTPALHPYPAYKPSGIAWLGDVPEHWGLVQLGRIGRISKGTGGTKEDETPEGIPCIRYGDLYTSHKFHIVGSRTFVTEAKALEYTPIQYGDILFAGSGETIEEIGKSAVNLMESPACCGGDVILFRPDIDVDARFSGYAIDCPQSQYQKSCMGRGITIMHIYGDELKRLWVTLPPLPEQTAIARYLDYVDRRVRRYVEAKRKLIALLEEERQAVIHQAVTRGLNPNVPLKPSGVDWLGDIPANWEAVQLGQIGRFLKGGGGTKEDEVSEGLLCIRYGDIYTSYNYHLEHCSSYITHERSSVYTLLEHGDILFAGSGETIEDIGKSVVNVLEEEAYCGGDIILCRLRIEANPRYMGFLMDCYQSTNQKSCMGRGITVMHIYSSQLKYMQIALPPIPEQASIVEYLDRVTSSIDAAIARARRQIELLEEYRTRLIADVVTGKLDVRAAAESLPDEEDNREPKAIDSSPAGAGGALVPAGALE